MTDEHAAQRRVVDLCLAGLTAVEKAAVMGRGHGTIRNLRHRALVRREASHHHTVRA